MPCVCPVSKHSSSGFTPASFMAESELDDLAVGVREHHVEDEALPLLGVLRVVHRAHVEGGDLGPALADVGALLGHVVEDGAGREVEDDRAALAHLLLDAGEGRRAEGGRAVVVAGVDVHHRGARVVGALGLLGDLDGRVRDVRALLAVGEHAGEGAGDDAEVRIALACLCHGVISLAAAQAPLARSLRASRCSARRRAILVQDLAGARASRRADRLSSAPRKISIGSTGISRASLRPLVGEPDVHHAAVLGRPRAHDEPLALHAVDDARSRCCSGRGCARRARRARGRRASRAS